MLASLHDRALMGHFHRFSTQKLQTVLDTYSARDIGCRHKGGDKQHSPSEHQAGHPEDMNRNNLGNNDI